MLKIYAWKGRKYQWEEGEQPAGAVEVARNQPEQNKEPETAKKAVRPANKSRTVKNK